MIPKNNIWIFIGNGAVFPSSAFTEKKVAEKWIETNKLSGMLSAMPVNQGLFDWGCENNAFSMKPEKLEEKKNDPRFIADCTTASLEHDHYIDGFKD